MDGPHRGGRLCPDCVLYVGQDFGTFQELLFTFVKGVYCDVGWI